jgi:ketosteroid isomerase-like protein
MSRACLLNVRVGFILLLLVFSPGCQNQTGDKRADEAALKSLDDEWSKTVGSRDVEKMTSYYSDEAIVMLPNIPTLTGKEAIRNLWKSMLDSPTFSGGWKATKVEVARSGDLAYITGDYQFTEQDDGGKPITDKGKYVAVWRKQADGSWRCVADMFNSDLPAGAPVQERPTR